MLKPYGSKKKIVIVGGGTAGWMAAAGLTELLGSRVKKIELIESPEVPTVGVGEATVPGIRNFNAHIGLDEIDFIKKTKATFKLGIQFANWSSPGEHFFHPFSAYGAPISGTQFHHHFYRASKIDPTLELADFCVPIEYARQQRFAQPPEQISHPLADYKYAYHLDAVLYAQTLSELAKQRGVIHTKAHVIEVTQHPDTGFIKTLTLDNGDSVTGDLFIDCTGFYGLLIEKTLQTGYEDWSHWLPVDRAIAVATETNISPPPYTVAAAQTSGWTWRIPLQHRAGNGYVYCSDHCSDDQARETLLDNIGHESPLGDPRCFKFTTGRRKQFWNKNCVSLGLSSGFLEPLESTSISLIQTGLSRLLMFFPDYGFHQADINEANRLARLELENIRDFLILHYTLNQRHNEPFWDHLREMTLPDSLQHKIDLFQHRGHIARYEMETFEAASWISVFNGLGIRPNHVDPATLSLPAESVMQHLSEMRNVITRSADQALKHQDFINKHCRASG